MRKQTVMLAAFAVLLIAPLTADAATYYVTKSGRDSRSCSEARTLSGAKLTINAALECLSGGDTLLIGDGIYNEVIPNNSIPSGSGTWAEQPGAEWPNATTIKAINRRKAVIQSPASCRNEGFSALVVMYQHSYIVWEGVVLDGNYVCAQVYNASGPGGVSSGTAKRHRFIDTEVKRGKGCSGGCGMIALSDNKDGRDGGVSHHEIINSEIHDFALGQGWPDTYGNHLVYDYCDHCYLSGNLFYDSFHSCITNHNGTKNSIIRNNLFYNCERGAAIRLSGTGNVAYNNIIIDSSAGCGEGCSGPGAYAPITIALTGGLGVNANNKAYNNTIYSSRNAGACIANLSGSNNEVVNNICYGGRNDVILDTGIDSFVSSNRCARRCETSDDPLFTDPGRLDFSLRAGSPMINAGIALSVVTTDYEGNTRWGSQYSIGAYETR